MLCRILLAMSFLVIPNTVWGQFIFPGPAANVVAGTSSGTRFATDVGISSNFYGTCTTAEAVYRSAAPHPTNHVLPNVGGGIGFANNSSSSPGGSSACQGAMAVTTVSGSTGNMRHFAWVGGASAFTGAGGSLSYSAEANAGVLSVKWSNGVITVKIGGATAKSNSGFTACNYMAVVDQPVAGHAVGTNNSVSGNAAVGGLAASTCAWTEYQPGTLPNNGVVLIKPIDWPTGVDFPVITIFTDVNPDDFPDAPTDFDPPSTNSDIATSKTSGD